MAKVSLMLAVSFLFVPLRGMWFSIIYFFIPGNAGIGAIYFQFSGFKRRLSGGGGFQSIQPTGF
ncbi:MAG: hypothetical protein IJ812_04380 [Schwartzia sp.]|nr:hypothetical protein [Schwartzia sp. (in: firmicutes)]MBR1885626.1 hypothetical protein [Schwartzia sp. (in: firmicutes)]